MTKPTARHLPSRLHREQALELLRAAQALVLAPERFTRYAFARDRWSHPVPPVSRRARRFCAAGALVRAEVDLAPLRSRIAAVDQLPPRLAVAAEYLMRGAGYAYLLRMRGQALDQPEAIGGGIRASGGSATQWLQLLIELNDGHGFRHSDLSYGFAAAIAALGESPAVSGGRPTSSPARENPETGER